MLITFLYLISLLEKMFYRSFLKSSAGPTGRVDSLASRHLTTESLDLYHVAYSSGQSSSEPPLVILHGLISSMIPWQQMARVIHEETGRTVIIPDARNHGRSPYSPQHTYWHMVEDTVRLIRKLGLSQVSVVGHSMGGRTAMALALLHPHLISSMIVIDVSPATKASADKISKFGFLLDLFTRIDLTLYTKLSEARQYALEYMKSTAPDAYPNVISRLIEQSLVQSNEGACKWVYNVPVIKEYLPIMHTFPTELEGFQYFGPSLFIAGTKSDYIGTNGLPGIHKYFPQAELTFVEGGHMLPFQNEKGLLRVICDYLLSNKVDNVTYDAV